MAAATARRASAAAPIAPARRAPARRAPARKPPARRTSVRRAPRRAAPLIPLAVGRTAGAVRAFPDCGAMVGLTRGRAWIPLLGILLTGIVAVNVLILSYTAAAGGIESQITTLRQENSVLRAREARLLSNGRVHSAAASLGMVRVSPDQINYLRTGGSEAAKTAAARLAPGG